MCGGVFVGGVCSVVVLGMLEMMVDLLGVVVVVVVGMVMLGFYLVCVWVEVGVDDIGEDVGYEY